MTDAADFLAQQIGTQRADDAVHLLMTAAPEVYPRRVVLEQESEGGPVVVRLLERTSHVDSWEPQWLFRLVDVPEEAQ